VIIEVVLDPDHYKTKNIEKLMQTCNSLSNEARKSKAGENPAKQMKSKQSKSRSCRVSGAPSVNRLPPASIFISLSSQLAHLGAFCVK
jgi:hypothetical protein